MPIIKRKITTNSRVLNELLAKYSDTFKAFCELINNSIQANATLIEINIDYGKSEALDEFAINSIEIKDNGHGVSQSQFDDKILEIGTLSKPGGQGVGRFGALQIGQKMVIETIAFDNSLKKYTLTRFPINAEHLKNDKLQNIDFEIEQETYEDQKNTYYSVFIEELYHNQQVSILKKNAIAKEFLKENLSNAIFEKYPDVIFNDKVKFSINKEIMKKEFFIIGEPKLLSREYEKTTGEKYDIYFQFYNVNLPDNKVKVFFQIDNAGLKTVAHEFTYSSDWYTPDLGTWYIYIDTKLFDSDLFRNLNIAELGEKEWKKLREFIKEIVNDFFKAKNHRFTNFVDKLQKDKSTQKVYANKKSDAQVALFNKTAYFVENDYKLIEKDEKLRFIIYPLIDRAIQDKHFETIMNEILKLSNETKEKLHDLIKRSELEDVIYFSSAIAEKKEFLEFLHNIVYGDVASVLRERSQLHKIIEKQLWLFGESYSGTPYLWSDRKIGKIFEDIRNIMNYLPTKEDDNLIEGEGLDDITDLFFFNEKIMDNNSREIMIVELKAPNCSISQKELNQIDKYAYTIETNAGLPVEDMIYKLILISSKLTDFAKSKMSSAREKYKQPFLYDIKSGLNKKHIEVYVIEWKELIESNSRKLTYLSNALKIKDKSVKEKFEEEYSELITEKLSARLTQVK